MFEECRIGSYGRISHPLWLPLQLDWMSHAAQLLQTAINTRQTKCIQESSICLGSSWRMLPSSKTSEAGGHPSSTSATTAATSANICTPVQVATGPRARTKPVDLYKQEETKLSSGQWPHHHTSQWCSLFTILAAIHLDSYPFLSFKGRFFLLRFFVLVMAKTLNSTGISCSALANCVSY